MSQAEICEAKVKLVIMFPEQDHRQFNDSLILRCFTNNLFSTLKMHNIIKKKHKLWSSVISYKQSALC